MPVNNIEHLVLLADIMPYHFVSNDPQNGVDLYGLAEENNSTFNPCACFSLKFFVSYWSWKNLSFVDGVPVSREMASTFSPNWALKYKIYKSNRKCCAGLKAVSVDLRYMRRGHQHLRRHCHRWNVDQGYQWSLIDGIVYPDPGLGSVSDRFDSKSKVYVTTIVGETTCGTEVFDVQ